MPLETKVKIAQQLVKEINKAALAWMMDAVNQVFFLIELARDILTKDSLLGHNKNVTLKSDVPSDGAFVQ